MEISTSRIKQEDFCHEWIATHFERQPDGDTSLTWLVGAWACFRLYVSAADRAGYQPYNMATFALALAKAFPNKCYGRLLRGLPVFTGVRFYEDRIGGKLIFGF